MLDENMLAELKPLLGHNFAHIVKQFCNRSTDHKDAIVLILSESPVDYDALCERAHALKSIAGQVGAVKVAEAASVLEAEAEKSGPSWTAIEKARHDLVLFLPESQEALKVAVAPCR